MLVLDLNIQTGIILSGEPTTAEKIAYGIDKQNMFLEMYFVLLKQVFKQHLTLIKILKK